MILMTIDYVVLFLFFVVFVVAVFLARKTVLDYKKIEEDRKDLRQDAAKQNQMILKQMQNQHEIDMLRIESAAQNGGADMMTLLQTVLPILLNNKSDNIQMSESEPTPTPTNPITEKETDEKLSAEEMSDGKEAEVRDKTSDGGESPKTAMRQWVDSPESDVFFERYKYLLKK